MQFCIARTTTTTISAAVGILLLWGGIGLLGQESGDLDAFRKLHAELRSQMDEDLEAATQFLESKIAESPDSSDLHVLRHSLATRMAEQGDHQAALQQFRKLLNFQIENADQSENRFGIWMTVQSMHEVVAKSRDDKDFQEAVDVAFERLDAAAETDLATLMPASQLAVLKAQRMVNDDKVEQATALISKQLTRLSEINDSDRGSEETMQSLTRMLRALTTTARGNDPWRDERIADLDAAVTKAIERYPDSLPLQTAYADTQFMMITTWGQDDPDANQERIEKVSKTLVRFAASNRSVQATLRRIDLHKERMASVKPVATLVGKPAPDWEIDAWVNAGDVTRDSLQGNVVLLDFWAMWCGPCIATFPHLRQWREEFGDKGFEIVGVTQYYNFEWDDEAKRASRADDDIDPQQERETLASFLEHHELKHPVIVTPEDSKMQSEFGVRGIPHVVLIDREGVIQLVKTGAGQSTADAIHAKIKELLEPAAQQ